MHKPPPRPAIETLEVRRLLSVDVEAQEGLFDGSANQTANDNFHEAVAHLTSRDTGFAYGPQQVTTNVVGGAGATGRQPTGALTGKIVFTVGGHGYTSYTGTPGGWHTQRPLTNSMVEDMGNVDQMTFYVNYLFNAG